MTDGRCHFNGFPIGAVWDGYDVICPCGYRAVNQPPYMRDPVPWSLQDLREMPGSLWLRALGWIWQRKPRYFEARYYPYLVGTRGMPWKGPSLLWRDARPASPDAAAN